MSIFVLRKRNMLHLTQKIIIPVTQSKYALQGKFAGLIRLSLSHYLLNAKFFGTPKAGRKKIGTDYFSKQMFAFSKHLFCFSKQMFAFFTQLFALPNNCFTFPNNCLLFPNKLFYLTNTYKSIN